MVGIGLGDRAQNYEGGRSNPERTMTAKDRTKVQTSDDSWKVETEGYNDDRDTSEASSPEVPADQ